METAWDPKSQADKLIQSKLIQHPINESADIPQPVSCASDQIHWGEFMRCGNAKIENALGYQLLTCSQAKIL